MYIYVESDVHSPLACMVGGGGGGGGGEGGRERGGMVKMCIQCPTMTETFIVKPIQTLCLWLLCVCVCMCVCVCVCKCVSV